ncbi:hypothetical protein CBR_g34368 [Chara braunii]|uniref:SHSP domain-containing protein n=1 Tax=Chara braunii TaxID=69332 RepID=A0A388LIE2_CHABU|nr:hypothetical protein CBR_g34368 [Chara braunii]|eukprot:GBG82088.1 hypothetical protein CBR_g34368 [Chara braunii]
MSLMPWDRSSRWADPFDRAMSPWGFWDMGADWPTGVAGTLIGGGLGRGDRGGTAASDVARLVNANVDWVEKDDRHEFKIDVPGLKKEEAKVEVEDGRTLVIRGQRQREETKGDDRWHRVERAYGTFERRFRLPETVEMDKVQANMDSGVLTIKVPKRPEPQKEPPKPINID